MNYMDHVDLMMKRIAMQDDDDLETAPTVPPEPEASGIALMPIINGTPLDDIIKAARTGEPTAIAKALDALAIYRDGHGKVRNMVANTNILGFDQCLEALDRLNEVFEKAEGIE